MLAVLGLLVAVSAPRAEQPSVEGTAWYLTFKGEQSGHTYLEEIRFVPGGVLEMAGQWIRPSSPGVPEEVYNRWKGTAKWSEEGAAVTVVVGANTTKYERKDGALAATSKEVYVPSSRKTKRGVCFDSYDRELDVGTYCTYRTSDRTHAELRAWVDRIGGGTR